MENPKTNIIDSIIQTVSSNIISSDADKKDSNETFLIQPKKKNLSNERQFNQFLLKKEKEQNDYWKQNETNFSSLYPDLNDPLFNLKIAQKAEFNSTQYDGAIPTHLTIEQQADFLSNAEFELAPHQVFVRNFLSFQTPYNSLLLFHGLGTGKTCSAIGVCEEMRHYLKQMGISKRIIIVASPNVQDNFKLQLFDERKLKKINGRWNMDTCVGNNLLKEINTMTFQGLEKEKVIQLVKTIINTSYIFMGYESFANYIAKIENAEEPLKKITETGVRNLDREFNGRLIVIDEIHNIRLTDDNANKKVAQYLMRLVESANNMRLLFLSATPMFNSYKEIVYLLNIMNTNDKRGKIEVGDIFDAHGNFKVGGEDLLVRKATGYISYIRGDNPFTFPYRVYPHEFSPTDDKIHSFFSDSLTYPSFQMNGKKIPRKDKLHLLDVYVDTIGHYQNLGYHYILDFLKKKNFNTTTKKGVVREMPTFESMESFGYTLLQLPLEALNIIYPFDGLENYVPLANDYNSEQEEEEEEKESNPDSTLLPRYFNAEELEEPPVISKENTEPTKDEIIPPLSQKAIDDLFQALNEPTPIIPEGNQLKLSVLPSNEESIGSYRFVSPPKKRGRPKKLQKGGFYGWYLGGEEEHEEKEEDKKGGFYGWYLGGNEDDPQFSIDPRSLTGYEGLSRIMDFVDQRTPSEKGSFQYKPEYKNENKRVFSPQNIGLYSSKIKNICQSIFDSSSVRVSEGIILIYSQYIDAGLIPIALALEEMGMVRTPAAGAKSLFKETPVETVDARTMLPRASKKSDFFPARYAMITGDPRISPDNDAEVKAATNIDNKEGNRVKVILISQAGTEGIDFKFIRQVHILEPWYNMSRMEQIIGRAVRNLSHKDLPFEKRNVQIFMHGTLLLDNNNTNETKNETTMNETTTSKEEAADLYVYRMAEAKAVLIGRISRLLKRTAVDCILNYKQTNYTAAQFDLALRSQNRTVKQILSNGKLIDNFKIGDKPYTSACDYMEFCEYTCRPFQDIREEDLQKQTYDEKFILINSEKLTQKIKSLFSDRIDGRYFFTKKDLLAEINRSKSYPLSQIYSALTQIIEDSNEVIRDKYGRLGSLVNIGDYYLFQPKELNNSTVSLFDRSIPIDYKNMFLSVNVKEKGKQGEKNVQQTNVLDFVLSKYKLINEKTFTEEDLFYKHFAMVRDKLIQMFGADEKKLHRFLIHHILDFLSMEEKKELLFTIPVETVVNEHPLDFIQEYFSSKIITMKKTKFLFLFENNKQHFFLLEKDRWREADPEDIHEITSFLKESGEWQPKVPFADIIGFVGEKSNQPKNKHNLVFKTKSMENTRNTGADCNGAGKKDQLDIINKILLLGGDKEIPPFTNENTKDMRGALCCFIEFILRFYQETKTEKTWFLDVDMVKIFKF